MANEGSGAQAAIVFADVSGSTQLYVQLGDNTARNVIAKALDYLSAVTVENGGVVIKTIGDEVMCRFPSADQGFDAAWEMQRRLKENAANISQQVRIAIRVGLQWGEVVEQADGDVFGDAVNIAARVAAIAKRDQIVTTELTVQALTGARPTSTRPFDRVALKGRVGEVTLCMIDWDEEADATRMRTVLPTAKAAPGASSKLQLASGDQNMQLFTEGKALTLGRSPECSMPLATTFASRLHARVLMRRGRFILVDESTNGTYILPGGLGSGEREVFIKREEFLLPDAGVFSLGQSCSAEDAKLVQFSLAKS